MEMTTATKIPIRNLFFETSKLIMIVPDTDGEGNFLGKYLLIDRNHYLDCKDKDPVNCNMFNMDRITIEKGDNYFGKKDWDINIKISGSNLTLEYERIELHNWKKRRNVAYKESLKLNRYYNSDCYGVRLTPFWYEKLSNLEIIK